jgi:hypothetical protein
MSNEKAKSVSVVMTLFDDEGTRTTAKYEGKWDAMAWDERNSDANHVDDRVEELLEFGKTYRITIEEVE